jgi:hypothetical protein
VFGAAGDAIIPLIDALAAEEGIRFHASRREDAAAFMASAYAKLTGKPGVCIGTSGPGAVNLLNGIADAAQDRVPLVAVTGQVESTYVGTAYKQYFDHQILSGPSPPTPPSSPIPPPPPRWSAGRENRKPRLMPWPRPTSAWLSEPPGGPRTIPRTPYPCSDRQRAGKHRRTDPGGLRHRRN